MRLTLTVKPQYSFVSWGAMMFTCGLAADILFYSFSEWIMYANEPYVVSMGNIYEWVGVFPLFHWSFIPWAFYLVLAVAFGFMLHVRKINRQRYSEACRPLLGKYTDGFCGMLIDLLAVFALIAGTATTFSIATPLMSNIVNEILGVALPRVIVTIILLVLICMLYTTSLLSGFKGISCLANICIRMFLLLLLYVLVFSGEGVFIIECGIQSLGRMIQNFVGLATYTDFQRITNFPQNWTIYYWAYWMVWCVAVPFFIGNISKGRKIKDIIIGGYFFGVGSTIISFIVLGNYSLRLQIEEVADFVAMYKDTGDLYSIIITIINTLPGSSLILFFVLIIMITFYATSFDSIALTASCYSYRKLNTTEEPHKLMQLIWCILLVLLPIALVFAESSMNNLQTVSIIAAFPIAWVMILIIGSFFRDANKYLENK